MFESIELTSGQALAHEQLSAFAKGEHGAKMMTLEGYAGTGKTTLVGRLVAELCADINIAIAAPTNKAVGVLRSKIGDLPADFGSIHSFLGLRLTEREDGTKQCRPEGRPSLHEYDLVIVDECSMIGAELFGMIVTSAHSCRVLFVGDPAQLPPVEGTQIRQELSPTFARVQHKAILTDVVRQAAGNPIIALSMSIRECIERGESMQPGQISCSSDDDRVWLAGGGEATAYNVTLGAIKNGLDARIVAYRNTVVDRYNKLIHSAIYGDEAPFSEGERVIVHEAYDDARAVDGEWQRARRFTLYTSEEATVLSIVPAKHPYYPSVPAFELHLDRDDEPPVRVYIPADAVAFNVEKQHLWSEWRRAKLEEETARMNGRHCGELSEQRKKAAQAAGMFSRAFAPIKHVYAMTAHKSQGSTIDTVVVDYVDLARMRDPFDFNRALYVAVTRAASNLAVVV